MVDPGDGANRFGLTRRIPDAIKRVVQRRDGHGCIVCGNPLHRYLHIDPPFAEAEAHDPAGIVLLCPACAERVAAGAMPPDTLQAHRRDPACRRPGFTWGVLGAEDPFPYVHIGRLVCRNVRTLIEVEGQRVIWFEPPVEGDAPRRLSLEMSDPQGEPLLSIRGNEWLSAPPGWQVQREGNRLSIRSADGTTVLSLRAEGPRILLFETLDLAVRGARVLVREGEPPAVVEGNGRRHAGYAIRVEDGLAGMVLDRGRMIFGTECAVVATDVLLAPVEAHAYGGNGLLGRVLGLFRPRR